MLSMTNFTVIGRHYKSTPFLKKILSLFFSHLIYICGRCIKRWITNMCIVCCTDVLSIKNVLLVRGLDVLLNYFFLSKSFTYVDKACCLAMFRVHREIWAMKPTCSFQSIWMVLYWTTLTSCCPERNSIQHLTFCKYSVRSVHWLD